MHFSTSFEHLQKEVKGKLFFHAIVNFALERRLGIEPPHSLEGPLYVV